MREQLGEQVNVPEGDLVQFTSALGAALLGQLPPAATRRGGGAAAGHLRGGAAGANAAHPRIRSPRRSRGA